MVFVNTTKDYLTDKMFSRQYKAKTLKIYWQKLDHVYTAMAMLYKVLAWQTR